jgi:hypothetical protein
VKEHYSIEGSGNETGLIEGRITFASPRTPAPIGSIFNLESGTKAAQLRRLFWKPRVMVVTSSTATTVEFRMRRPTWQEWFGALRFTLRG